MDLYVFGSNLKNTYEVWNLVLVLGIGISK